MKTAKNGDAKFWQEYGILKAQAVGLLASAIENGLEQISGFEGLTPRHRVQFPTLDNGWRPAFCSYNTPTGWKMPESIEYGGETFLLKES